MRTWCTELIISILQSLLSLFHIIFFLSLSYSLPPFSLPTVIVELILHCLSSHPAQRKSGFPVDMDTQDHKTAATSIGHEGHGVYLCHRCGWPFPKPHPSAKHRRAHKRHCGTIEGFKIILSEEHDHNLAVSDGEHASDGEHTPNPILVMGNAENSVKVGDKDDVYSDAVTEFSDIGIIPRLEERFESVKELSMEQKGVDGDLQGGGSLKVDEVADRNEQSNDPGKSEEVPSPEPLVSGTNQSGSVIPLTGTTAEAVHGQGPMKSGQDSNIQPQEDKMASDALISEEAKILEENLCEKSVSEVVKHDLPFQTETLENLDASKEENSVVHSAKRSASDEPVEVAFVDMTRENIDASVGVEEVSQCTKDIGEDTLDDESISSTLSVKPDEDSQTIDATKHAASMAKEEVEPKSCLDRKNTIYYDASEVEKSDMNGKESQNMEFKEFSALDTVPIPDSADKIIAPEDDQTTGEFKKGVDHDEKSNGKLLETGDEKSEGAFTEVKAVLDSKMPSADSTGFPSSVAVDSEARDLEELSKEEHGSLESRDDGFEKSIPGLETVGSCGIGSELNHDIADVLDKNALPTASSEVPVSPIISEPSQNIHVTGDGDRVESVDVAETISELKEIVSSEETPEQSIANESASLTTESELLSENSANNVKASESIETARVTSKLDHEDNVVLLREIPENFTPQVQEASLNSIVSSGEHDGNVLASGNSVIPSLKEPTPSPSDFLETCATGDDKTVANVEDVTGIDSKSLQAEVGDKLTKENDGVSAVNRSGSSSSQSDSLEANCGSVVSDTLETNSQKHRTEEARSDKSDTYEPPSFMTLVQPGGEGEQVKGAKEIETEEKNQEAKHIALQAGWFPSIKNVVNESEGRKKNEEIIAKVTNWSPPLKQQHGPLSSLLNEVKSPNTKQVPASYQKNETETKDNNGGVATVGSVIAPEARAGKDQETKKDVEWNSPARYPIEIKKEKKKGRSFWVPFVCCSSVHRDL
ncbi:hypothetical protein ACS0TY_020117 [Phlomoides rotata]